MSNTNNKILDILLNKQQNIGQEQKTTQSPTEHLTLLYS